MTLPASGSLTIAQVNTELGYTSSTPISMNQASVRSLLGKPSGSISFSDGRGKPYWNRLLLKQYPITVSDDRLTVTFTNPANGIAMGQQTHLNADTSYRSFEVTILTDMASFYIGVSDPTNDSSGFQTYGSRGPGWQCGIDASGNIMDWYSGNIQNMASSGHGQYWRTGDVVGVRIHADYIQFFKNGIALINGSGISDMRGSYGNVNQGNLKNHVPAVSCYSGGSCRFNFGASPWAFFVTGTNGNGWHL